MGALLIAAGHELAFQLIHIHFIACFQMNAAVSEIRGKRQLPKQSGRTCDDNLVRILQKRCKSFGFHCSHFR